MTQNPHPWAASLPDLYSQVWARLVRGVADRRSPARHPTLTTVSTDGKPKARTVVLRAVDLTAQTLDIHTDLRSGKIADVAATPFAALHIWDAGAHLQVRLEAEVALLSGTEIADIWSTLPAHTRATYGIMPAPGQPIADALGYVKTPIADHFGVLRLMVETIEVLHLGPDHRRARFALEDAWAGTWLVP
jgi:pyridoxamine 5'-phosphate oxidase